MSQQEMAHAIGCNRSTYADVETGKRYGRSGFWTQLQTVFHIPDSEMWSLTKNE